MSNEEGLRGNEDGVDATTTPLCPRCLARIDPSAHYCATCGEATGRYTPYIPYVNIRFTANFYVAVWRKIWHDPEASLPTRILCMAIIVLCAPVMLVALPFVLWGKRGASKKNDTRAP